MMEHEVTRPKRNSDHGAVTVRIRTRLNRERSCREPTIQEEWQLKEAVELLRYWIVLDMFQDWL